MLFRSLASRRPPPNPPWPPPPIRCRRTPLPADDPTPLLPLSSSAVYLPVDGRPVAVWPLASLAGRPVAVRPLASLAGQRCPVDVQPLATLAGQPPLARPPTIAAPSSQTIGAPARFAVQRRCDPHRPALPAPPHRRPAVPLVVQPLQRLRVDRRVLVLQIRLTASPSVSLQVQRLQIDQKRRPNQDGVLLRRPSLRSDSVAPQPSPLAGHGRPSPPT